MNATASAAVSVISRPFARIPEATASAYRPVAAARRRAGFPILHDNDADIDSMANAAPMPPWRWASTSWSASPDCSTSAMPRSSPSARTPTAFSPPISCIRNGTRSGSRSTIVGLVAKLPAEIGGGSVVHFTLSFWLALPLAAAFAAFFGVLFGAPTLRLRGDYLAIVTLGFGEIVPIVVRNWSDLTNGAAGLNGVAAPHLFGWSFGVDATPYYYVAIALVALLIFVSIRLRDSRIGRAWMAIREDEIAAGGDGRRPHQVQVAGFRHRRRVRRHDRRVLCREAADRDAGDVRLPGLGDDPGDGRVRRHRQRVGRRAGRVHPATAAIVVAAGPDRVAARAGPDGRQRLAAARRPGASRSS